MKHDHQYCEAGLPHSYIGCCCECHAMEPWLAYDRENPDYRKPKKRLWRRLFLATRKAGG